jgi:hypothetical protein
VDREGAQGERVATRNVGWNVTEKRKVIPRRFDRARAAQLLADARALGSDEKAAKQWGVSSRTIRNYRTRMQGDAELAGSFRKLEETELAGWSAERILALNAAMKRARELIPAETSLKALGEFVEKVGAVDVAKEMLGGERAGDREAGEGPAGGEDPAAEGAGGEELPH